MATIHTSCPNTGRRISTGIDIGDQHFIALPDVITARVLFACLAANSTIGPRIAHSWAKLRAQAPRKGIAKGESRVTKHAAIAASIDRSPRQINLLFMLLFKSILEHRAYFTFLSGGTGPRTKTEKE